MKSCRVFFRDRSGVEHAVTVQAAHRYHAFGLTMFQLRRCSWCNPDYREVQRLTIQLLDGAKSLPPIVLTRAEFERWLAMEQPPGGGDKTRDYLLMLLGRKPPDRDFKRGMSAR